MPSSTQVSRIREEKHLNKRPWLTEEDNLILALVGKYGPDWVKVSNQVEGRTGKQCRERYYNHLQENIKKGDWTLEEDQKILRLQKRYGNHWVVIMKELPGRTDNAVKNRFHALKRAKAEIIDNTTDVLALLSTSRLYKKSSSKTSFNDTAFMNSCGSEMTPSTPTSITNIVTPTASNTSRFMWRGTCVETIPEESEDQCLEIQTSAPDIESMLDCLSPIIGNSTNAVQNNTTNYITPVECSRQHEFQVDEFSNFMDITDEEWDDVSGSEADDELEFGHRVVDANTPNIESQNETPLGMCGQSQTQYHSNIHNPSNVQMESPNSLFNTECRLTDDEKEEFCRLFDSQEEMDELTSDHSLSAPSHMIVEVDDYDTFHHVRENSGKHTCYPIVLDTPDLSSNQRHRIVFSASSSPVSKKLKTHSQGSSSTFSHAPYSFSMGYY